MDHPELSGMRNNYRQGLLDESQANPDPFNQFSLWFSDALDKGIKEPNAMTLATAGSNGRPSARIVLMKGFTEKGFIFYTDYSSRKGRQLAANPYGALVFLWKELERQVRVEGKVVMTSPEQSDHYFNSRPEGSRISALASHQSRVISDRTILEKTTQIFGENFRGKPIPRPARWGGYLLQPGMFEFWQGRSDRLHDRLQYNRVRSGSWKMVRLAP
ncbi:MAG TPA: pyridoxamine 5'-phosphate oxidase [Chitinophagaceae bacterium]|nr:pyridoxamine 5'-phosphate oxidase [Chitinophagaceae bacterium]